MIIFQKNKHTLQIDEFLFNCSIGKNGKSKKKKKEIKKPQKDYIHLVIYIIDQIDYLNLKLL